MSEYFGLTCTSWLMFWSQNLMWWWTVRHSVVELWLWDALLLSTPRCISQTWILVYHQPLFVQINSCLHAFLHPFIENPKLVCQPCFPFLWGVHVFCPASLSTLTCTSWIIIIIFSMLSFGPPLILVTHSFRHFVTKKWNNWGNMKKNWKKLIKCKQGNYSLQPRKLQKYFPTGIYSFRQSTW